MPTTLIVVMVVTVVTVVMVVMVCLTVRLYLVTSLKRSLPACPLSHGRSAQVEADVFGDRSEPSLNGLERFVWAVRA